MSASGGAQSPVLIARGLSKRFGSLVAVDGLDLTVAAGECLAFLGPNGAGKTTTVEMLEGLTEPSSGSVEILGRPLGKDRREVMQQVGVLLQETALYKRYTVLETLQLFASFYRTSLAPSTILERLALTDKARVQLRKLSGGQKQRVYLGCALIHDPQLLFLDEPTTGLDPQARRATWDLLSDLKTKGKSLVLTTHYMEEAQQLADRIAVIDHGKIIAEGTAAALIQRICGGDVLQVVLTPQIPLATLTKALPWLETALPWQDGFEVVTPDAPARISSLFAAVATLGAVVRSLNLRQGTLEDVFLKLTGRSMRDE